MVTDVTVRKALEQLALLKFFPANNASALAWVGGTLKAVCRTDAEIETATSAVLELCNEWSGPASFRQIVRGAVRPNRKSSDGVDPNVEWIPPTWAPEADDDTAATEAA